MPQYQYGNSIIEYSIQYKSNKRDITVAVDLENGVCVIAPNNVEDTVVDRILHKKAPWILKKVYEFNEIKSGTLAFHQGRFIADIPKKWTANLRQAHFQRLFCHWYIMRGTEKVNERIQLYGPKMECYPNKFIVQDHDSRWGSCTNNGVITINWKILMAPMRIVDYVVVHELAHLKHPDHSPAFWTMVQSILPDYENRKEWLRIHGPTLDL